MSGFSLSGDCLPSDASPISVNARLELSRPFTIEAVFFTADKTWSPDDALMKNAAFVLHESDGRPSYLEGVIHEAGFDSVRPEGMLFTLSMRSGLDALSHRADSRVFTDKSRIDVIKQVLQEAGLADGTVYRLREAYEPREMICQYRESDLAFISRLCELEGIFYTFDFDEKGHHLVFGDNPDAFVAPDPPIVLGHWGAAAKATSAVQGLKRTLRIGASVAHVRDFDVKRPANFPESVAPSPSPIPLLHYESRGGFTSGDAAKRVAAGRLAGLRARTDQTSILTSSFLARPGIPLTMEGSQVDSLSGDLVPVEVQISATQAHPSVGGENVSKVVVKTIPKGVRWAPTRSTDRPKIRGLQTARVTGPPGGSESIHTDSLGRIKVRFHWDRSGKNDDTSSAWVRVSQVMMGGSMVLPRVGWEVAVAFEGGEPDRPLVLGRVYSAEEMPPYSLPGEAASTAMKSRSSPGGAGANEIKMGDTGGSQGFGVTAQKDMNTGIGNNKKETVAGNETVSVGADATVSIGASETVTVGGSQKVSVGNAYQNKISGAQVLSIGGSDTVGTTADLVESTGGARIYAIGGSSTCISNGVRQELTGASTLTVSGAMVTASLMTVSDTMLSTFDETVGAVVAQLTMGSNVEKSASKTHNVTAAIGHVCTNWTTSATDTVLLTGGVHLRKIAGDLTITGSKILLGGAYGKLKAGGAEIKLGGGPVTVTGDTKLEGAAIVKMGSNLVMG